MKIAAVTGFAVLGSCLALYLLYETPESALIEELQSGGLLYTNGVTLVAEGPPGAKLRATKAERAGIDLFALYQSNRDNLNVRLGLAYMLVLLENQDYLDYASDHRSELIRDHEFRIWTFVLENKHTQLCDSYRGMLIEVLTHVDVPYARLFVAKSELVRGAPAVGVRMMLDIMRDPVWATEAYEELRGLAEGNRIELLLPYLETESARGAYAAMFLADIPDYRTKAIGYLERLKRSENSDCAEAAMRALMDVESEGPDQTDQKRGSQKRGHH